MRLKERAEFVAQILNHYFPHPPIPLKFEDHYTLLIAVLLSARCTDVRVNQVTPHLFKLASTPQAMMHCSVAEIKEIIRPCGLSPQKSKSIQTLSKILVETHHGKVPDTFPELEALPGVGHKTASVVISQGFNRPAFPVDTHIYRCARRWKLSTGKTVVQVERDLKKIFPEEHWNKLHLQIIHFARKYCPARGRQKKNCPICSQI